jgi:hypothetical protein
MKLKKQDYNRKVNPDGSLSYEYTCKGNTFYIRIVGVNEDRTIFVYKNDEYETNLQNVFSTKDNFLAWQEFERLVDECSDKPQSSGGFKKDPQANPFALPLLAIKFNDSKGKWDVKFFVQAEQGGQSMQVTLQEFELEADQFTYRPKLTDVFEVDWSEYNVPDIFKSVIVMKKFESVVFEEDPESAVFLFLPKNVVSQGGTPEPKPDEEGEPTNEKGEPKPDEKGEPTDEKGEPSDEKGEPTDEKGEPTDEKGEPTDEDGEPTDEKGEPTDEDGKTSRRGKPKQIDDLLSAVAQSIGADRGVIEPFFITIKRGEAFLIKQNFAKIKRDLGLPDNTTAKTLSENIINQRQ